MVNHVLRSLAARFLFVLALITLVALALYPNLDLPPIAPSGRHSDFVYHMIGFLLLSITAMAACNRMMLVLFSMAALAVLLECLQFFVPGRGVFMIDVIASLLGVGLSWPLSALAIHWHRRLTETVWLR